LSLFLTIQLYSDWQEVQLVSPKLSLRCLWR